VHARQEVRGALARVYRRGMRRVLLTALVVGLLGSTGVALAAGPTINTDPHRVAQGGVARVFGVVPGCARGNTVTLMSRAFSHRHEFAGVPAIFATVGRHHRYSKRTTIPAARRPARYRITGRCGGGNLGVIAHVRVTASAMPVPY
jgi:hypothetical protein